MSTSVKPILFSAPMVQAILREIKNPGSGKTQTRRIIKQANSISGDCTDVVRPFGDGTYFMSAADGTHMTGQFSCPYGKPGDLLYVRETWTEEHPLAIQEGRYSQPGVAGIPGPPPVSYRTIYHVDGEPRQIWRNGSAGHPYFTLDGPVDELSAKYPTISSNYQKKNAKGVIWTPSIHMPRWASRLTLEITDIRVERLQSISEEDAESEGTYDPEHFGPLCEHDYSCCDYGGFECACGDYTPQQNFQALWTSINGPESWEANPWVWAVSFKPHLINVDRFIEERAAA